MCWAKLEIGDSRLRKEKTKVVVGLWGAVWKHGQGRISTHFHDTNSNTETAERRQNNGGNARRSRHTFPPPPPPLPTTPTVYHPPSPPSLSSRAPLPEPPLAKSPLHSRHDSPNHHWQHSRRPRPGRAPHNDSLAGAAAAAEGEEALPKRRPPVPRLRARRGVRPLQRGGDRGAGPRQGPCRHRPQPRRPRGHLRAHRPAVRAGVEARHGRGRGRGGRRLPGPRGGSALQPLGRRLRRQARGPCRADGRRAGRHAGGGRGRRPRGHRQGSGWVRLHRRLI